MNTLNPVISHQLSLSVAPSLDLHRRLSVGDDPGGGDQSAAGGVLHPELRPRRDPTPVGQTPLHSDGSIRPVNCVDY